MIVIFHIHIGDIKLNIVAFKRPADPRLLQIDRIEAFTVGTDKKHMPVRRIIPLNLYIFLPVKENIIN